jgi:predicted CoA-binding protein
MSIDEQIREFLAGSPHAVVGASRNRSKYGNKVLRAYLQNDLPVYPVNPNATMVEGQLAYPDLASIPRRVHGVSVITPPRHYRIDCRTSGDAGNQKYLDATRSGE